MLCQGNQSPLFSSFCVVKNSGYENISPLNSSVQLWLTSLWVLIWIEGSIGNCRLFKHRQANQKPDRWHGIKRVRWGVMMETQHSGWYWAFWKAALATSAVSPFLPLTIPPQPGFATVCYQESKCGKAAFLPVCFELSMPSPIHILTLQLREIATASPCWDLYLQLQKEHDYKPAAWIPL